MNLTPSDENQPDQPSESREPKILAIARQADDPDDKSAIGEAIALELHAFQDRVGAPAATLGGVGEPPLWAMLAIRALSEYTEHSIHLDKTYAAIIAPYAPALAASPAVSGGEPKEGKK